MVVVECLNDKIIEVIIISLLIMKHSKIFIIIWSIFGIPVFFLIKVVVDLIKVLLDLAFYLTSSIIFHRKITSRIV